jgi:hypothetical protein
VKRLFDAVFRRRAPRGDDGVPRFRLADLPEDTLGKLTGNVEPLHQILVAPLSGRRCVYYACRVVVSGAGIGPGEHFHAIPFVLVEGEHRAIIDPAYARFVARHDHVTESRAALDANPAQRALLEAHDLVNRPWFRRNRVRYSECVVAIHETVSIIGVGIREPDRHVEEGTYREGPRTRLHMTGSPKQPLVIRSIHDGPRSMK